MTVDLAMPLPGAWSFETATIAAGFDSHVREQLPWYELVTGAVAHLARHYIPKGGLVYDLGCSTGNIGRAIEATLDERGARLIPVDASAAMCARYDGPQRGNLLCRDVADLDLEPCDLAICFLVLMFLPVARRRLWLRDVLLPKIRPGGAVLVFDKCLPAAGYPAVALMRLALAAKLAVGSAPADILAKELSLGGVQRPLDPAELGPAAIEVFRFGDFAGWLIEQPII